ncbi:hypothetical protein AB5J56_42895 [Streptomyces sp. R21]|uniref:ATPase n=1 Tax=Streptomyces sp. R21 TaxID=3238627 RepID=A0AB39PLQ0_9ACTN
MWTSVGGPEGLSASSGGEPGGLIGRERESAVLRGLLAGHRLVTVAGTAGVGKSRLAAGVTAAMTDGPWQEVVEVRWQGSGPGGPGALTARVVQALTGVLPCPDDAVDIARVVRDLPSAQALLFLDDVDPVHRECLSMVQHLLMAHPDLRVLVTSRRALGLGDEHVLRLAPLSAETPGGESGHGPAVELFLARARAAAEDAGLEHADLGDPDRERPGLRAAPKDVGLPDADLRAATSICRRLDGVPLAIELAAEQTVRHSVRELAELLERHQNWLNSPHPTLRRHRSLREAIGASYVLCERAQRIVWARASTFGGSFTESTAVFLCAGGGVEPHHVPACLAQLTAVGVLEAVGDPGGPRLPRYRMTRTAREFGAARLREAGEFPVAAERRVVHCRRVAAVAENLWGTGDQSGAVRLVLDEQHDLGAMIRYALTQPEHAEAALETVVDLWFWWAVYDRVEEGRDHVLQLLPLCEPDAPVAVRGLWLAAWLSACTDPQAARALLGRAWPAAVRAGDDAVIGRVAHVQGMLELHRHDFRAAAEHFQEAADTIPPYAPGGPSPAVSLAALAVVQAGFSPGAARRSARRALTHPGVREDEWAGVLARYARAFVDHRRGHSGRAWHRARRTLTALDAGLPAPHGSAALRLLLADIEAGAPGRLRLPSLPPPRTELPVPAPAAGRATR